MHLFAQIVASFLLALWPIWAGFSAMLLGGPGAADKPQNLLTVFAIVSYPVLIGWYFLAHSYSLWGLPPKVLLAITALAPVIAITQLSPMIANIARGIRSEGYSTTADAVYLNGERIASADPRTFQNVGPGYSHPYYGKDTRHVFVDMEPLEGADPASFELLSPFARDKDRVWLNARPMPEIDAKSFAPLLSEGKRSGYWRDKSAVYSNEAAALEGADPDTFRILDGGYARDRQHVYWTEKRVTDADPETFRYLMPGFGVDARRVYRRTEPVLPEAHAATLKPVLRSFARDDQHVFWLSDEPHLVQGLDPESFEELEYWYVRDKAGVYYTGDQGLRKLAGADPATFEVREEMDASGVRVADAHDRHRRYREGAPVAP